MLRIVSMMMIVVLHVLGHGELLNSVDEGSAKYYTLWFLETMAFCAVNCYGLISGYVGYGKKFKLSNLFYLWLEVVFYSISIGVVFKLVNNNIGLKKIVSSLFPVSLNAYWYFSAYFIMFFFTPFFNYLIERLSKRKSTLLVCCIILLTSILQLFAKEDLFSLNEGYTALWLSSLYIIGAYIKKYHILSKIKKRVLLISYFLCVFISFGYKFVLEATGFKIPGSFSYFTNGNLLISYNSPTILLCGIVLLLLFARLQPNKMVIRLITLLSPATFGVYLIHDNVLIQNNMMPHISVIKDLNVFIIPCVVLGIAIAIWLLCSVIDIIRIKIFELIKVRRFTNWLELKIRYLANKALCRISLE